MFHHVSESRQPLTPGAVVQLGFGRRYIIDKYLASGGFSLMYIAHLEGSSKYVALKELFPRCLEDFVAQRQPNGAITIYNPITETSEPSNLEIWKELIDFFVKEVRLTKKAGLCYDSRGKQAQQNSPDVLPAEGPFEDDHGNCYLVIDTYQGESLRDMIERGFVKNEDGVVRFNQYIGDILSVLAETALHLVRLHSTAKMYHLDLSPDNIYVVKTAGGTKLTPHVIDYGSAYDRDNPDEETDHRYTFNPHSPPEVKALAELQEPGCGYQVDASSDTYAIASILFYAVTGLVFTADQHVFAAEWKRQIWNEYGTGIPGFNKADTFASGLITFFEQGLADSQGSRYASAKDLYDALCSLKKQHLSYGNLLPLIDPDELMTYMVLEKNPLYNYKGKDGNINVLCLGSGVFVKRMILSLISCGQMLGSRLNIQIVSGAPESEMKNFLLTRAPLLEEYSNLVCGEKPYTYVTFHYRYVRNLLEDGVCQELAEAYPDYRYVVISLGENSANAAAANLYAAALAQCTPAIGRNTIINYYCSEEGIEDFRGDVEANDLPGWLRIDAFGRSISSYGKAIRDLGQRTIRLAHLYNKLDNPRISLAASAQKLAGNEYDQRSSCASALHLKYKLASVGINPAPNTNKRAIIAAYQKVLAGADFGKLMELEHRRWMMYMIADGYTLPTTDELRHYGFEVCNGSFNKGWKSKAMRLHPCLVPCSDSGLVLTPCVWSSIFARGNAQAIQTAIKESDFDELDKTSLRLHFLAKEKCQDILSDKSIELLFDKIARKLQQAQDRWSNQANDEDQSVTGNIRHIQQKLRLIREEICSSTENLCFNGDGGKLDELRQDFDTQGINISEDIQQVSRYLEVFAEYAAMTDYKAKDEIIISNLLWILYADHDLTLVKLRGKTIADNITGPLVLEPRNLIYFGSNQKTEWEQFFHDHGYLGRISYAPCESIGIKDMTQVVEQLVTQLHKHCVLDITGAEDEVMTAAALKIADRYQLGVIRSTPKGRIENISGFHLAPIYTLNTTLSAGEIYSLQGAREIPSNEHYMVQLGDAAQDLWTFYLEFQDDWEMVTAFFANRGTGSSEFFMKNVIITQDTPWKPYTRRIDAYKWKQLGLNEVFRKMTDAGFIRNFQEKYPASGHLSISFEYPFIQSEKGNDSVLSAFNLFFTQKMVAVFSPYHCGIKVNDDKGITVNVVSGCQVDYYDRFDLDFSDKRNPSGSTKRYNYADVMPALERLQEIGLITDLNYSLSFERAPVQFKFAYSNLAVRDCLVKSGNILEFYVWSEAKRTGFFDDCASNFSFAWQEGVQNELDVILTKGLCSLVISCKTAKFNKEHLYEIKYLTDRFSLNSKPIIVYSSQKAYVDGHITDNLTSVKNRAKAMGVYLIDLNCLNGTLGEELVQIAQGKRCP